jgi:hypothetical protein
LPARHPRKIGDVVKYPGQMFRLAAYESKGVANRRLGPLQHQVQRLDAVQDRRNGISKFMYHERQKIILPRLNVTQGLGAPLFDVPDVLLVMPHECGDTHRNGVIYEYANGHCLTIPKQAIKLLLQVLQDNELENLVVADEFSQ